MNTRKANCRDNLSSNKEEEPIFDRLRIPEVTEKEIMLKIIAYNIRRTLILNYFIFNFIIF